MPFAAAIRFKENGTPKYFNPAGLELERDDFVWVKDPGSGGLERIGFVSSMEGRAAVQMGHLPRVLRYAEEPEIEAWYELKTQEREMLEVARERAAAHDLPIKVSDLVFVPDKRQVLIIFTSDQRIDFRELVKDLAGHFKARIEMWQIGARKEAGLKDGYGVCGNPLCCGSWLKDFPSITMRYAREQDIIQPPSKLSGPCGKLRCCLRYEHETYLELADGVATRGCRGCSSDGKCGVVADRNLLKGELTLRTDEGSYVAVPAAGFVEEAGEPATRSGSEGPRAGREPGAGRRERREARGGAREEPHRWAPGEAPEEEQDETVVEEEDGGISATTGSRGGSGRRPEAARAGDGEAGRRERRGESRGEGRDEGRREARGEARDPRRGAGRPRPGFQERPRAAGEGGDATLGGDARSKAPESTGTADRGGDLAEDLEDDRPGGAGDRRRGGRRRRRGPRRGGEGA